MISVKKEGVILNKTHLGFEDEGVLNPAVMQENETVHVLYRAVRKGNNSTIGYCRLNGPLTVVQRDEVPLLFAQSEIECKGLEDPRIVRIEGIYYLTYTAYNGHDALGYLAVSIDLKTFEKQGVIVPQITYEEFRYLVESTGKVNPKYLRYKPWESTYRNSVNEKKESLIWDKNVILFPRKINGQFVFLHRIRPDIQLVRINAFEDLTKGFWEDYLLHLSDHIVMQSQYAHEYSYIGGGCPPVECAEGWIIIYHGVCDTPVGFVYSACVALLDREDPGKELSRLPYPLFSPEYEWELEGFVNNVCFPTGTSLFGDTLYIYYGAADEQIACASLSISALIAELVNYIKPHEHVT